MKQLKIGRGESCDVIVDDTAVSRFHAELFHDDHGIPFLTDNNSSNGTFVNGSRIAGSVQLGYNDIVKVGNSVLPWRNYIEDNKKQLSKKQVQPKLEKYESENKTETQGANTSKIMFRFFFIVLAVVFISWIPIDDCAANINCAANNDNIDCAANNDNIID